MLSRTSHIIYLSALLVLSAIALRPAMQRNAPKSAADLRAASALVAKHADKRSSTPLADAALLDSNAVSENMQFALAMLAEPIDHARPDAGRAPATSGGSAASGASAASKDNSHSHPAVNEHPERFSERALRGEGPALTSALIDRCLEVAGDIDRDLGAQLLKKRQENPQEFERLIRQAPIGRRLLAMAQLKQRDPELYQVKLSEFSQDIQVKQKAAELRQAVRTGSTDQIEPLKAQLRMLVQLQLLMSIKSRGEYLCRIEEQIQAVRDEIDREASNFHATVEGRLQHFMEAPSEDESTELMPVSTKPNAAAN